MPDLEKLLAKIYTYSIRHKVKAIYFENVSLQKLKEFRILLRHFKSLNEITESLMSKRASFKSERLRTLLTLDNEGGVYPSEIGKIVDEFDSMIVWKRA